MFNLKSKIKKLIYIYISIKEYIIFGNWNIIFSKRRRKIKEFTNNNMKEFSKTFIGNYLVPTRVFIKLFQQFQRSDKFVVFSLGLGKQITFDKDFKSFSPSKVFLAGFEPSRDCFNYCKRSNIFDFLGNAAIVDEKTYQYYKNRKLSLQGSHVIDNSSFKETQKSIRDEKSIKFITPALAVKQTGIKKVDFLKIDIENNTIPVIKEFLNLEFPPQIIVGEIEYYFFNRKKLSIENYIKDLQNFFSFLKEKKYTLVSTIDQRNNFKYHSIEFIAVNKSFL